MHSHRHNTIHTMWHSLPHPLSCSASNACRQHNDDGYRNGCAILLMMVSAEHRCCPRSICPCPSLFLFFCIFYCYTDSSPHIRHPLSENSKNLWLRVPVSLRNKLCFQGIPNILCHFEQSALCSILKSISSKSANSLSLYA